MRIFHSTSRRLTRNILELGCVSEQLHQLSAHGQLEGIALEQRHHVEEDLAAGEEVRVVRLQLLDLALGVFED